MEATTVKVYFLLLCALISIQLTEQTDHGAKFNNSTGEIHVHHPIVETRGEENVTESVDIDKKIDQVTNAIAADTDSEGVLLDVDVVGGSDDDSTFTLPYSTVPPLPASSSSSSHRQKRTFWPFSSWFGYDYDYAYMPPPPMFGRPGFHRPGFGMGGMGMGMGPMGMGPPPPLLGMGFGIGF